MFVADKTANNPNKNGVLSKYTTTVTYLEVLLKIATIEIVY